MLKRFIRHRNKELGLVELVAIALGGMVGGGIFSILGISVEYIGNATPVAILIGGILALFAAHAYIKLTGLYKDEGATYSFFKKTFPSATFASAGIGWLVVFGYISTLALYAFTFSSYFCSQFAALNNPTGHAGIAGAVLLLFTILNLVSVKGMGMVEDWLVYIKLVILLFISGLLAGKGQIQHIEPLIEPGTSFSAILTVAAITFVAYEGFQLVIHAYHEVDDPDRNIPKAIYRAIVIALLLYVGLAVGTLVSVPKQTIIDGKEYALASGASQYLGPLGLVIVIFGALLATSSAISGTLFGASRLMAVIAEDGYLPRFLSHRIKGHIPTNAIILMAVLAFVLILSGGLQLILEFGSITFILVSFLMAYSNFKVRKQTHTSSVVAIVSMLGLFVAGVLILYLEYTKEMDQLYAIGAVYAVLILGAWLYSRKNKPHEPGN
ncbi:MAG: amino acid permease [Flavobacteriales bacterium]|nr:amino acid permease [Flavobacteriales bacterium]